jgi:hypothetical protein
LFIPLNGRQFVSTASLGGGVIPRFAAGQVPTGRLAVDVCLDAGMKKAAPAWGMRGASGTPSPPSAAMDASPAFPSSGLDPVGSNQVRNPGRTMDMKVINRFLDQTVRIGDAFMLTQMLDPRFD